MSWSSGVSIADKMKAANAAQNAAMLKEQEVEAKFVKQYGVKPRKYILDAVLAAYAKTSKAEGYQGRTSQGQTHTDNIIPTDSPSKKVIAYHNAEDAGKLCAQKGDISGAITKYHEAEKLRVEYQNQLGSTDTGHANAIATLQRRRASLTSLKANLDTSDPDVVAARLVVSQFYKAEGLTYVG